MKITHHLPDRLLMAYAAGELPEAFALAIATHVSLCDDCRARLAGFEAVGGAVLDECAVAQMSAGSLAATMALIRSRAVQNVGPAPARPPRAAVFPKPLRDYVGGDLDAVTWKPVAGGVRQAVIHNDEAGIARLLYIPAGVAVPDHGHRGLELTQVLRGAFRDEHDRFGPGDIEVADEHTQHTPVAEPGEDCICLAVTDAPLRFRSLLPRMAQPFLGI